jgi:universal stress protein A
MSESYRNILLAADFAELSEQVCARALALADKFQAALSLLHVVENLPIGDFTHDPLIPMDIDLTEPMMEAGRKRLDRLGEKLGIPEERRHLEIGSPKAEIVRIAKESDMDLIVVGSHGRHGIGLLLGSTAASVIHHAHCDVLAVRLIGTGA